MEYQSTTEASGRVRAKLDSIIETGRSKAVEMIGRIERERPVDRVVNTRVMRFTPDETEGVVIDLDGETFKVHRHAINQGVDRTGLIGQTTVRKLLDVREPWANELVADIMNRTYANIDRDRLLVREVGGQVRGILSDHYRRMDSGPIFEQFIHATRALGAVPTHAMALDTKMSLTMMLPMVFSPTTDPLGHVLFGATLSNSDFGDGALSLMFSVMRCVCTNLAVLNEAIRRVHLGKRLSDDVVYSEQTYQLDTATQGSAIRDMVAGFLGPANVNNEVDRIRAAASETINVQTLFSGMRRKGTISKGEQDRLVELYNTPDVEMLPAGNTLWRAANAVSLFAQDANVDPDRAFQLHRISGGMLQKVA